MTDQLHLKEQGHANIFVLTQAEEHRLMAEYFARIGKFPLATTQRNG